MSKYFWKVCNATINTFIFISKFIGVFHLGNLLRDKKIMLSSKSQFSTICKKWFFSICILIFKWIFNVLVFAGVFCLLAVNLCLAFEVESGEELLQSSPNHDLQTRGGSFSRYKWWVWVKNFWPRLGLFNFMLLGSGQPSLFWVWVWKISPEFFCFFPFGSKKSHWVGSKSTWVKDGSASCLLRIKSMLVSGRVGSGPTSNRYI